MFETPIAFFVFNRPQVTQKVFAFIREVRPTKLYIVADGPRIGHDGEIENCINTRRVVMENIDWPCEIHTNFSERNLGCKWRMSSGIDWVFSKEENAIILEDDCVPDLSFFVFCEELLRYYRDDPRIMSICGGNYQEGRVRNSYSYYFSKYPRIWGWATWRRAWHYYDVNMRLWPEFRDGGWLLDYFSGNEVAARYWHSYSETVFKNRIDTWDLQWQFAHWVHGGVTIIPNKNMISNIGYGDDATHTKYDNDPRANLPLQSMDFPLKHPKFFVTDHFQDTFTQKRDYHIG